MATQRQCKHKNKKTGHRCRNQVSGKFQYCHRHRKTNKAAAVSNGLFRTRKETIPSPMAAHKDMRKQRSKVLAGTLGGRGVPSDIRRLITDMIGDGQSGFEKQMSNMQMQIINDKFLIKGVPKLVRDSMGLEDSTFVLDIVGGVAKKGTIYRKDIESRTNTPFTPTNIDVIREVAGVIMYARFLANQISGVFSVRITAPEKREVWIQMFREVGTSKVAIVAFASPHFTEQPAILASIYDIFKNFLTGPQT